MRKFLTSVGMMAMCVGFLSPVTPTAAGDFSPEISVIDQPGQTLIVRCGPSEAIVFYERRGQLFELTVVMTGDGEVLRARIPLADGQGHAMILNSEDGTRRDRFTMRRSGNQILVTGKPLGSLKAEL
ncbi:MAG: hypothetical protein AAGA26_01370 [Pseudomonadota bacterium]